MNDLKEALLRLPQQECEFKRLILSLVRGRCAACGLTMPHVRQHVVEVGRGRIKMANSCVACRPQLD